MVAVAVDDVVVVGADGAAALSTAEADMVVEIETLCVLDTELITLSFCNVHTLTKFLYVKKGRERFNKLFFFNQKQLGLE